jgi:hypothetical protein
LIVNFAISRPFSGSPFRHVIRLPGGAHIITVGQSRHDRRHGAL